jgi:hypothetical protein
VTYFPVNRQPFAVSRVILNGYNSRKSIYVRVQSAGVGIMKISKRPVLFLTAVLAGLPVVSAYGQNRVNTDGHLYDANPRVGSGGLNSGPQSTIKGQQNLNGDVVTGNVSGLNYFHGNANEFNPNVVQIRDPYGAADRLTAIAAQPNLAAPNNGTPNYTSFYSTSRATPQLLNQAAIPGGALTTTSNNVALVPAPTVSPLTPSTDTRVDALDLSKRNAVQSQTDATGPGVVNPAATPSVNSDPTFFEFSPLYGVRKSDGELFGAGASRLPPGSVQDNSGGVNIDQLRKEVNDNRINQEVDQAQGTNGGSAPGSANPNGQNAPSTNATPGAVNLTPQQLGGVALNNDVNNQALSNTVDPLKTTTSLQTDQHFTNTLQVPVSQQSAQLATLIRRYGRAGKPLNDQQAAKQYNAELAAKNATPAPKPGLPDGGTPALGTPDLAAGPAAVPDNTGAVIHGAPPVPTLPPEQAKPDLTAKKPELPPVNDGKPMIITSLATGVAAPGMAGLLKKAEDEMRDGKFSKASDLYDSAEQVAPNNPFAPLGRSFAELGSSYYVKADADLAKAVSLEPAVLGGLYDLKGFLGEDRLKFVEKDLADVSASEKAARPEVLLAFIAHNAGDDTAAASHLEAASIRGGDSALIASMRSVWNLPAKAPAPAAK